MIRGKEGLEWATIAEECKKDVAGMFEEAVEQEKAWANYLFQEGSIIGLNAPILQQYVEYIANQRMKAIKLDGLWPKAEYRLRWMDDWISSGKVQEAPQETEKTAYLVGFDAQVKDSVWDWSTQLSIGFWIDTIHWVVKTAQFFFRKKGKIRNASKKAWW